ncbi:MAG: glycosyltransferase [Capsulimonadales bacterium]|nr:glycosyltransferase [Capsulimonadales bacterium]
MPAAGGRGRDAPPLRILNYAINGLGLGHLTRLLAINRQLRRLSALLAPHPAEITFLTSSEADSLAFAHDFAAFKIPARGIVGSCGLDPARYRKIGKQWVWNAINLIAPDILIVDTFPSGSFHELYDVLDFGQKNVFIYRAVRPEAALQPAFQTALRGYDRILLPAEQGEHGSPLPEGTGERAVSVGEILIRSASEILTRADARLALGLPETGAVVYVSTGGGGDTSAETIFRMVIETAERMPNVRFLIGAGTLYRGREYPAANVVWSYRQTMMEYFRAFDLAVTAGGFNSVNELMHCGIPCVFLPQPRSHDDQERRVARCVAAGAGVSLPERTVEALTAALSELLEPERNADAARVAASLVPTNHALRAAEEILSLIYEEEPTEQASLLCDPEMLTEARRRDIPEHVFLGAARLIREKYSEPMTPDRADEVLAATLRYLRESQQRQIRFDRALTALRRIRDIAEDSRIDEITEKALAFSEGTHH